STRRTARQTRHGGEDETAGGEPAVAAAEAGSHQARTAEGGTGENGNGCACEGGIGGWAGAAVWAGEVASAFTRIAETSKCALRDGISSVAACRGWAFGISPKPQPRARESTAGCGTYRTAAWKRPRKATLTPSIGSKANCVT